MFLYEGIIEKDRCKWDGIKFFDGIWLFKIIEWKFNNDEVNLIGVYGVCYGIVVFVKLLDLKYVYCMFIIYKLDFKMVLKLFLNFYLIFWGLYKWLILDKFDIY